MPRVMIVRRQIHYRVVHHARPGFALPPPKKGGGGWLVALGVVGALFIIGKLAGGASDALPAAPAGRQVRIEADAYDQCYLDVAANGETFRMLGDSGAAGVFFPMTDARRLGFNPRRLAFDHSYEGWGWKVNGATVRLRSLEVAGVTFRDVEAAIDQLGSVTDAGPLLGSPVLKKLNFQVHDGYCTLTIPE
jgi:clan AA aspartic protease (TIGR02281 family)